MRCSNCKVSSSNLNHYCWEMWGICGKCAKKLHPEFYELENKTRLISKKIHNKKQARQRILKKLDSINDEILHLSKKRAGLYIKRDQELAERKETILRINLDQSQKKKEKLLEMIKNAV